MLIMCSFVPINVKYTHKMKRYIFILLSIVITSLCAYSQEEMTVPLDNSQETSILTSDLNSEKGTNPNSQSSVLSTITSYAYSANSAMTFDYKKTQEWGKYTALRAVGWTTFGVGMATLSAGVITFLFESSLTGKHSATAAALSVGGGVLTLSSIPILISAYHYRNKAKKLSLNVGVSSINAPSISNRIDYKPALSFALNF